MVQLTRTPRAVISPTPDHQPDPGQVTTLFNEIVTGVDAVRALTQPKTACALATTANITLSGEQTIDGTLTSASRVLVKNQSTASQNGVYVTGAGAWTRATDLNTTAEISLAYVLVTGGSANAGKRYQVSGSPVLDTDAVTWVEVTFDGDLTALELRVADFEVNAIEALQPLTPAADRIAYYTSGTAASVTPLTAAGRALIDDANADAMLTTLGGTAAGTTLFKAADAAAQRTALNVANGADVTATALAPAVVAATEKTTPAVNDLLAIADSADSNALKRLTWANALIGFWTGFGQRLNAGTAKTTIADADNLPLSDSASSHESRKITWANFKLAVKDYTDTLYPTLANLTAIQRSGVSSILHSMASNPAPSVQSGRLPWVVSTTKWQPFQPMHQVSTLRVTAAAKLDCSYMIDGSVVHLVAAAAVQLYAGDGATFWGRAENSVSIPINGAATVSSIGGNIAVNVWQGTATWSTISAPIPEATILLAGQSQMVRFYEEGGVGGFVRGVRDIDWMTEDVTAEVPDINTAFAFWNGATGGTALDYRSISEADNPDAWWYNYLTATNGPALTNCLAQIDALIAAGHPAPEYVFWAQGESDAGTLQTGVLTEAQYLETLKTVLGIIRTKLIDEGATDPQFILSMLGSWDQTPLAKGVCMARAAHLQAITDLAYAHQGPEIFDLGRDDNEIHLNERGNWEHGFRLARHYAALENSSAYDFGPIVASAVSSGGGLTVTATITGTGTLDFPPGNATLTLSRGGDPNFFGGAPFGMAIQRVSDGLMRQITSATVSGSTIVMTTAFDVSSGHRLVTPAGYFPSVRDGAFVRDRQSNRTTGQRGLPLRTCAVTIS